MKQILFLLILITTGHVNGQSIKKGLLMPDEGFDVCCFFIPTSGLKVYEQPKGKIVGKISLGTPDHNDEIYSAYIQINEEKKNFSSPNFTMVGYEVMAMTFQDTQSNFIQLQNGYWLDIDEVTSKKLKLTSWMTYIIKKDTEWYANEPGLNLRKTPSINSDIIEHLNGDLWGVSLTNETHGNWCKVNVVQYRKHPCSGEDNLVIQTLSGWIKLLSDEQLPNVWNYGKGC
ncbi:MAG: hypothetical protein OCD76_20980 [Reichenbachiella sp.]